jgi:3-oxoacyl-[acyl-carrier protein] reductase
VPVLAVAADLTRPEGIAAMTSAALERFGRVDVLVTNNGGPPVGVFETHDWQVWQRSFEITLRSAIELTRAVLPGMRERRWGRVLHVTSLTVKQPIDGLMLSTSIRAALTGFSRALANEVATQGITVNTILPGFMNTERVVELNEATAAREGVPVAEVDRRVREQIPMRRIGEPNELAALAVFLASERASYITGQSIAVDGGWIRSLM